jgi:serine/threonine protein kinase
MADGGGLFFAVKIVSLLDAKDAEKIAEVKKEAKLLAEYSHDNINIIKYYDHFDMTVDGIPCLVIKMEYAEGGSLADKINSEDYQNAEFNESQILNWLRQIVEALAHLHKNEVLHRDIHPGNILIKEDTLRLADFGLSRELKSGTSKTSSGSPSLYASQERATGGKSGSKDDTFSLGWVLAEMVTKKSMRDHNVKNAAGCMRKLFQPGAVFSTHDGAVQEIIHRCETEGSRFMAELVGKLLELDVSKRISAADLSDLLGCLKMHVGLFSSPAKDNMGRRLGLDTNLQLLLDMRDMEKSLGKEQELAIFIAASTERVLREVPRLNPELLVLAAHADARGIIFQDENEEIQVLAPLEFVEMLERCTRLNYLFLNACNTKTIGLLVARCGTHPDAPGCLLG